MRPRQGARRLPVPNADRPPDETLLGDGVVGIGDDRSHAREPPDTISMADIPQIVPASDRDDWPWARFLS
jgi:hypothetical protein